MAAVRIVALLVAIGGVLIRPRGLPAWALPLALVGLELTVGALRLRDIGDALSPLRSPLAFLLLAVPLAVMLDRLGFFTALAVLLAERARDPAALVAALWIVAALVTTLLNLDAAVVLLTPLYIRIARARGLDTLLALAYQPALMACLASSALPVSNLTNLIATEQFDLRAIDFAVRLAPASSAAVAISWLTYRRVFADIRQTSTKLDTAVVDRDALRRGGAVVVFVALGFTLGDAVGVPAWVVAAAADGWLLVMVRRLPWRAVPVGAALVAATLGVLAAVAAPSFGLERLAAGSGVGANVGGFALAVLGANAVNNLPALLIALRVLPGDAAGGVLWAVLYGVNAGPALVVSGSLAGLLWLDAVNRLGVTVDARTYTRLGLRVALPALLGSLVVLVATLALTAGTQ